VIGRVFWTGAVSHLLDGASPDFAALEEREFVRRRAGSSLPGEQEYVIKHALTRETAYVALLDRERIEAEAPKWLRPGTYGEAFAIRALGVARRDRSLIRQAAQRFEAMQLSWHVEQTEDRIRALC